MVVNVELKSDGDDGLALAAAAVVTETGWAERVVISSFDPDCLEAVGRAEPGLALAWLFEPGADALAKLDEALGRGFGAIHPFVASVDAELVDRAHRSGLDLRVWTVNSEGDLQAMVDLEVDAVITDQLAEALEIARSGPNGGAAPR
jgi:glycerophosphoryl diester phosphodiesterase